MSGRRGNRQVLRVLDDAKVEEVEKDGRGEGEGVRGGLISLGEGGGKAGGGKGLGGREEHVNQPACKQDPGSCTFPK